MARYSKETKDELYERVLGKNAPNRNLSDEDLKILSSNLFDNENLPPEWKQLQENSLKLQQQSQELLNNLDVDLEGLRSQIVQDFGKDFPVEQEETLTIVQSQAQLTEKFDEIEKKLNEKVLCQWDYNHSLITAFRRPMVMGSQPSGLNNCILITGQTATGRHSSVSELAKLLVEYQVMPKANIATINLAHYEAKDNEAMFIQDVYSAINNDQIIIFDNLDAISPTFLPYVEEIISDGQLTLNKRYTFNNKQLVETSNALVKEAFKSLGFAGKYVVFITSLPTKKLLNVVGNRFLSTCADVLNTKDIVADDILEIYHHKAVEFGTNCLTKLKMTVTLDPSLETYVKENFLDSENATFVVSFFAKAYEALAQYKLTNITDELKEVTISAKDNELFITDGEEKPMADYLPKTMGNAVDDVKKELDNIVGLEKVKSYILSLEGFYAAQKLREKQGLKTTEVSKHMIFTGNPGTGKTTIARLLAKYLKAIGVLSNGQLIEVSRNDLVGKYMGHTAPQTMQVIKSAMGGILFIDEAYSLYRGNNDSFGLEAIDTLVKAMEDNRDDLIVILAGYTKEMGEFLESNSGLKSRFPNIIEFPDYTGEELYKIACINAKSAGYRVDEGAKDALIAYFNMCQMNNASRSGNGRLSRNTIEEAILHQSTRIISDSSAELDLLVSEDFNLTLK